MVEIDAGTRMSGITWVELFALFDTTKASSTGSNYIKHEEANQRAQKRKGSDSTSKKKMKEAKPQANATVLPNLQEEINMYRQTIREIAKREAGNLDRNVTVAEERQHLGRLVGLGVLAH